MARSASFGQARGTLGVDRQHEKLQHVRYNICGGQTSELRLELPHKESTPEDVKGGGSKLEQIRHHLNLHGVDVAPSQVELSREKMAEEADQDELLGIIRHLLLCNHLEQILTSQKGYPGKGHIEHAEHQSCPTVELSAITRVSHLLGFFEKGFMLGV